MHPSLTDEVRYNVLVLQFKLRQRLLQVLYVLGGIIKKPLVLIKIGPHRRYQKSLKETSPQQDINLQLLKPLGVDEIGLMPKDVLNRRTGTSQRNN